MNKTIKLAFAAAVVFAAVEVAQAIPITGTIGIDGSVYLDTANANTATEATGWGSSFNFSSSGTLSPIPAFPSLGSVVSFTSSPWFFDSSGGGDDTLIQPFWSVYGFTFHFLSSTITRNDGGHLDINFTGTVSAAGYDTTAFIGAFSTQNDLGNSGNSSTLYVFSSAFSSTVPSVPDGGMTVLLLGSALAGVGFLKRKSVV